MKTVSLSATLTEYIVVTPHKSAGTWNKGMVTKANRTYYTLAPTQRFPKTENYKGLRKALLPIHTNGDLQVAHPTLPIWFRTEELTTGQTIDVIPPLARGAESRHAGAST